MSVNHDELKRMIDQIPDQDAVEVHDFIEYLNLKREHEAARGLDVEQLSTDEELIRQVWKSREDRQSGRVYEQEAGLDYLRMKVEEFERGQNL